MRLAYMLLILSNSMNSGISTFSSSCLTTGSTTLSIDVLVCTSFSTLFPIISFILFVLDFLGVILPIINTYLPLHISFDVCANLTSYTQSFLCIVDIVKKCFFVITYPPFCSSFYSLIILKNLSLPFLLE